MTDHEHDDAQDVDEASLADDLEIKDGEDADAVKGGTTVKLSPLEESPKEEVSF
jgi:hypothetical protein